ncbi:MAG TPA: cupin domain-containing protein [Gammaproteobacteria bacterium]|nr:cupin domain-containing protein [Gammaproteobacteria bacterium]
MLSEVRKANTAEEYLTPERCHITEVANDGGDEQVSIARARVEPGVTTAWHRLAGIGERYLIVSGLGRVQLGELEAIEVGPGDVVRIPAGVAQRIANIGKLDLVFYAICSPPFSNECYEALE